MSESDLVAGSVDSPNSADDVQRQAAILHRHLPEGYSADPEVSLATEPVEVAVEPIPAIASASQDLFESPGASATELDASNNGQNEQNGSSDATPTLETLESSLKLQGGDIHRDMFKIKARANSLRRSNTFSHHPSPHLGPADELTHSEQLEPGGFRRQHLRRRARQRRHSGLIVANTFVDFLDLYGSFAGEALEDTDEEEDESAVTDESEEPLDEQRPLLGRPKTGRRKSSRRLSREGDASTVKTFFTLLKAFIGTGILFLPKAFRNGGILFSSLALVSVSLVNCFCFRLLLDCRHKYGGGYGELGESIVGPRFRNLILASIAISQLGFVCSGMIFTAENLFSFLSAVTKGAGHLGVPGLLALQFLPLIPLALIRNISKLGPVALVADVFILVGLVYIWYYDIGSLARHGIAPSVRLFNPSDFPLTLGSAIFTFEGIGLILPIQSSMKKPHHFKGLLYFVMFLITAIFTSVGALCYATFGENTKIQIISNFPQDSPVVNAVQFLYSLAVLAGEPVQLFPAVRILETSIFGERATGKKSAAIKWKKNGLRTFTIGVCIGIAVLGANDLDKFVALIGSVACVPLVYIYPAYLHYRGVAENAREKVLDALTMVVGSVAMVYTTGVIMAQWIHG
ncbi:amino acid transporter, transmembrane [Trichoderma arundinaceum]|uniref:Amino acid transporter, transmembrane n=1 Tax=Trichoderma arundinaceum TaxID=490622 RepID=A0A395NT84_TRIAR|nr:amino acid transporter, transmembrane [Trichoderma arundinaceum]